MERPIKSYLEEVNLGDGYSVGVPVPVEKPLKEGAMESISARHTQIIIRHLMGWRNLQIAAELGMSEQSVSQILRQPLVREKINEMKELTLENVVEYIKINAGGVAEELLKMFYDRTKKDEVRAKIGLSMLDRGGAPAVKVGINAEQKLTKEDLQYLLEGAKDGGLDIEDATIIEEEDDAD